MNGKKHGQNVATNQALVLLPVPRILLIGPAFLVLLMSGVEQRTKKHNESFVGPGRKSSEKTSEKSRKSW